MKNGKKSWPIRSVIFLSDRSSLFDLLVSVYIRNDRLGVFNPLPLRILLHPKFGIASQSNFLYRFLCCFISGSFLHESGQAVLEDRNASELGYVLYSTIVQGDRMLPPELQECH